ncbi:MAG TPA: rRNA methyltransferase [Desulfonauticus sp.]|nr:MAG: tRNA/rRNA methyltransferase (SpoU) [Desulfonauticus sp. 38_4375]MDK2921432.1 tRNA/rRNA methyltransferase [Desulfonauticus sp.]HCO12270.1 rRNA methyltransferase [Desulfonauticus sp.]
MLENLSVILVRPKFSENIGSVARACANMGCPNLYLVNPLNFDLEKALPLATPKGKRILEGIALYSSLEEALKNFNLSVATTARIGGWRKNILLPEEAAQEIKEMVYLKGRVALVFGSEDKGLTNEEISLCSRLVSIPTMPEAWSLNLAQAVMILLYECFKQLSSRKIRPIHDKNLKLASQKDLQVLFDNLKETLLAIDFLHADNNPDYFMLPVKRFFNRVKLRKNEYNLFMGICRQIKWLKSKVKE